MNIVAGCTLQSTHPLLSECPARVGVESVAILVPLGRQVVFRENWVVEHAPARRGRIEVLRLEFPAAEQQVAEARLLVERREQVLGRVVPIRTELAPNRGRPDSVLVDRRGWGQRGPARAFRVRGGWRHSGQQDVLVLGASRGRRRSRTR